MTDTFDKPVISGIATDANYVSDPLTEAQERIVRLAWLKFDDLFDSRFGGPHLKDRSKNAFDAAKTSLFLSYAIGRINYGNPPLTFTMDDFPYDTDSVLLSQALVIEIILHLMRSYTEQPTPTGSGYARLSRQDYLQRWQAVLEAEMKVYEDMVRIFRRRYLNLGHTAGIIQRRHGVGLGNMRGRLKSRGQWW
jgi:hypothetical protein